MSLSFSWEANSSSFNQEIPRILRNKMIDSYHFHTNSPLVSHLSQLIIFPFTPRSFPKVSLSNSYTHLPSPRMCHMSYPSPTSCFDQPNICWEVQIAKLFVQSHFTSFFLGPNIVLNTFSRKPLSHVLPSVWETKFHTHVQLQETFLFCTFKSLYFGIANWKTKYSAPNDKSNMLLNSSYTQFWNIIFVPKYYNFATLPKILFYIFVYWFCPAFCARDINTDLDFSSFTSCSNDNDKLKSKNNSEIKVFITIFIHIKY